MGFTSLRTNAFSIFMLGAILAACKTSPAQPSPEVELSCREGLCRVLYPDSLSILPRIKLESQPRAPLQLIFEPSTRASKEDVGSLKLENTSTKSISQYVIKYQLAGNEWRNELFSIVGLSPSFSRPPGSYIQPGETRPLMAGQVKLRADSEVFLRMDAVVFADGERWLNDEAK
jgi:hypothetical protein